MIRALREAAIYIAACLGIAAILAFVWFILSGGRYLQHVSACLVVLAALLPVTGAQLMTKTSMANPNAWLGVEPRTEKMHEGALTSIGIFLFVSLPLVALGLIIL